MTSRHTPPPVQLTSPPDVIGAIPSLVGFHPSESVVLVCMHGARNRIGLVLRVDLPESEGYAEYVDDLSDRVSRTGADRVIVVCFTTETFADARLPRQDLIAQLHEGLARRDIDRMESLLVRDDWWWSYTCTEPCCPPSGTPLPRSPSSTVTEVEARCVLDGHAILANREELERSVQGPGSVRRAILQGRADEIGDQMVDRIRDRGLDHVRAETLGTARAMCERFVRGDHEIDDDEAVRVLVGILDKGARDPLLTWGMEYGFENVLPFMTALCQRAVDEIAVPICAVLAGVAYQHGNGALAAVALERALRIEPDNTLAGLLRTLLDGQVPPAEIRAVTRRLRDDLGDSAAPSGDRPAIA
ncbi:DUF4192 domain-containing protein [Phytoactinopolyspora halophila]|nr:DUF4192 domain-containing protein [Phytoactinopolyspora halophila]